MNPLPSSQRGAILIVTLVMLLLLTLLALGSMRGTTLEERMAGNLRDESQAFQASEMAQRAAEIQLKNISVAALQGMTTAQAGILNPTGLQPTTYSWIPLPGVRYVAAGESIDSTEPGKVSVVRITSSGKGAAQDAVSSANGAQSTATSSTVNISTLYIRR
ncbi:hypothetical protein SB14R_20885 [Pseudomonas oryzihabitans]|nr:hypothetical protein NS376_01890 [Pseudomonas psychrotolerans]KTT21093.1 hypothetical protein SB14R_20885 [Pseudomonas psychrotolerans]KTT59940.1 hypothetical protein SB8_02845 [Pseudomonas psychrotolerans]